MRVFILCLTVTGCPVHDPDVQPQKTPNILVLESDYATGLISGWTDQFGALLGSVPSGGDARLIAIDSGVALLERSGTDAVTFFDQDLRYLDQIALPERSNPHDLIEHDDSFWISLYQHPNILRLSSSNYQLQPAIDGSSWTDRDGRPEASAMHVYHDTTVFILVQNLDFTGVEPVPPESSQLLQLSASGELLKRHLIPGNPFGAMTERPNGDLVFACNRSWNVDEQAGLWRFNPDQEVGEFLIQESELNGNILDFEWYDDHVYLVVSKADFTTALYRFSPAQDELTVITGEGSEAIGCIKRIDESLFICDRTVGAYGLRKIDTEHHIINAQRIKTTLAPLQIVSPLP